MKIKRILIYVIPAIVVIAAIAYLVINNFKEPDTVEEIDALQKEAARTTTTKEPEETATKDIPTSTTESSIQILGLGDLEANFNKIYGEPEITSTGSEYKFVGGTIIVTFAPDKNENNRAWQLLIQQRPSSRDKARELSNKFIPQDAKKIDSEELGLSGAQESYTSKTLADSFPPGIFLDDEGKEQPGFFRVLYDIDQSNLVFQIRIVGGSVNI